MIPLPAGVRVWLATGYTDMRIGFPSLALQVQEILHRDPLGGHLFCFRGRRGNLLKVIWHDGQGACLLFTKRLERGRFLWPSPADGVVTISAAQVGYLLSGIDWRHPLGDTHRRHGARHRSDSAFGLRMPVQSRGAARHVRFESAKKFHWKRSSSGEFKPKRSMSNYWKNIRWFSIDSRTTAGGSSSG
jgi:transposase